MANTRTLIKSGEGNATAALLAGTVSNVAVVTLPSDPGYEYEVSIAVMFKTTTSVGNQTVQIGGTVYHSYNSGTSATVIPMGGLLSSPSINGVNLQTSGGAGVSSTDLKTLSKINCGPGTAITTPIISTVADTYFLHYTYIGRKTITESF